MNPYLATCGSGLLIGAGVCAIGGFASLPGLGVDLVLAGAAFGVAALLEALRRNKEAHRG